MDWKLDKNKAICPQICEKISVLIASGVYKANEKLPSVRELALDAGVNPNTVQRSYETLEQQGIIYTQRNSGRFVSEDVSVAQSCVEKLRMDKTKEYISDMKNLGLNPKDTMNYIGRCLE